MNYLDPEGEEFVNNIMSCVDSDDYFNFLCEYIENNKNHVSRNIILNMSDYKIIENVSLRDIFYNVRPKEFCKSYRNSLMNLKFNWDELKKLVNSNGGAKERYFRNIVRELKHCLIRELSKNVMSMILVIENKLLRSITNNNDLDSHSWYKLYHDDLGHLNSTNCDSFKRILNNEILSWDKLEIKVSINTRHELVNIIDKVRGLNTYGEHNLIELPHKEKTPDVVEGLAENYCELLNEFLVMEHSPSDVYYGFKSIVDRAIWRDYQCL